MRIYRFIRIDNELCAYGESHVVSINQVMHIAIRFQDIGPDVSGYNQPAGTWRWATDNFGRDYVSAYNAMTYGDWLCEDDETDWTERLLFPLARDEHGTPLTRRTPRLPTKRA